MTVESQRAAQYIRMSTDRQDLSPVIQKEAIAAFAVANAFAVVATYEDKGRSGVSISGRPGLRRLLKDVADGASFTSVLVYDVSRWGRFQDADAAAYYEYHCRLNGVGVVYIGESFTNDQTPTTVLLKSMRRVMAAEYSRDLAWKARAGQARVVAMGFHMGPLPPLGYRRCSVSADGSRRLLLEHGQLKTALTDRIEWVLGPEEEVALVRRICSAYVSGVEAEHLASLVRAGGWQSVKGSVVTVGTINRLLRNEALIGNFVWGAKSRGGKILKSEPTRVNGTVPRIIDDATWKAVQSRLQARKGIRTAELSTSAIVTTARPAKPKQLTLPLGDARTSNYRRTLGPERDLSYQTAACGRALRQSLAAAGVSVGFDPRINVLTFWDTRIRIRLLWPVEEGVWALERTRFSCEVQHVLLVRMSALNSPFDFVLMPRSRFSAFPRQTKVHLPRSFARSRCESPDDLIERLLRTTAVQLARRA